MPDSKKMITKIKAKFKIIQQLVVIAIYKKEY